jgi:PIN domain nuclease of toxin-antitoxin system
MLRDLHKDPADRLIIATTIRRSATLLTADERLLAWAGDMARHYARL